MKRGETIGAVVVLVLMTLLIYFQSLEPPMTDWTASYHKNDKKPLGGMVFFEALENWAGPGKFEEVNVPVFEFLSDPDALGTYFLFNREISFQHSASVDLLLEWVSEGNTLFIAASNMDGILMDSLGLKTKELPDNEQPLLLRFTNPNLKNEVQIDQEKVFPLVRFTQVHPDSTTVLAQIHPVHQQEDSAADLYFIRHQLGKGQILVHTLPMVFSNYFLLQDENMLYMESLLAYLPEGNKLYYDNYYKDGKTIASSPLYLFLSYRPLKSAYYLTLGMGLLWIIFGGKRRQRAIPVINPLRNQSLTFIQDLTGIYQKKSDYKSMTGYQIKYLTAYLKQKHHLNLYEQRDLAIQTLSERFELNQPRVRNDLDFIEKINNQTVIAIPDLMALNRIVETYTHDGRTKQR